MEIWSATVDAFTLLASGDAALWLIVWVSLKVAIAGLLLAAPPGLLIAYLIAMHRFMGRRALVGRTAADVVRTRYCTDLIVPQYEAAYRDVLTGE